MSGKRNIHQFQVQLNWLNGKNGLLSAKDTLGTMHVATPPAFGGEGKPWTPEHFFLGAISSCFMTTFLAYAKKFRFEIVDLECESTGQIEFSEGKLKFTHIDVFPKVYIENESLREKVTLAMDMAHKSCLISNSIKTPISFHPELLIKSVLEPADRPMKESLPRMF